MVPVHSANISQQPRIGLDARARRPRPPVVEPAAGDAQHPAQHGNPELRVVLPDELVPHGSAFAKYAAAFFRMSRSSVTCLSSRFRRSSSFCSSRGLRYGETTLCLFCFFPAPNLAWVPILPLIVCRGESQKAS